MKRGRSNIQEAWLDTAARRDYMEELCGSVEEMPLAYKDIDRVMYTQETLVEVQGKFMPRIVRMNKE